MGVGPVWAVAPMNFPPRSWASPTAPLPMEINPRVVFERMFGDGFTHGSPVESAHADARVLGATVKAGTSVELSVITPGKAEPRELKVERERIEVPVASGRVAERDGKLVGICHYIFHRSTARIAPVCYLQDLFTAPDYRGHGIGRALIERVYELAKEAGSTRVYWLTHTNNTPGRTLYDKVAKNLGFIQYVHEAG